MPAKKAAPAAPEPTVRKVSNWTLVTVGEWEVSIGPDAMIMLPRFLVPADVDDFCAAAQAAAKVALQIKADNEAREKDAEPGLPVDRAIVTEGPPPAGAMRVPFSTIGRRR